MTRLCNLKGLIFILTVNKI